MDKETKRILWGLLVAAVVISGAFGVSSYLLRKDALLSHDFAVAADVAYRAIQQAEVAAARQEEIAYPVFVSAAERALANAKASKKSARDEEALYSLNAYLTSVETYHSTLRMLARSGGITPKAFEVQTAALVNVKTETVKALQQ